jgi:hypothetical protein
VSEIVRLNVRPTAPHNEPRVDSDARTETVEARGLLKRWTARLAEHHDVCPLPAPVLSVPINEHHRAIDRAVAAERVRWSNAARELATECDRRAAEATCTEDLGLRVAAAVLRSLLRRV